MTRYLLMAYVLTGCAAGGESSASNAVSPPAIVHHGEIRRIMMGDWEPNADLDVAGAGDAVFAVGALSDLRGEILIVAGQTWLSYPTSTELPRVEGPGTSDERATLLVTASVTDWQTLDVAEHIPAERLEATLVEMAEASGLASDEPFPFLLAGPLSDLHWHVVDGAQTTPGDSPVDGAQHGEAEAVDGTIVGFHSTRHQGIYTMMGTNVHMHVVASDGSLVGHVQQVALPPGATVSLPR